MQLYRHQITAQEIDHELIWLLVSLGTLLGFALWFAARLPMPQCAFHTLTGLPCVTCGTTRAVVQFFHGHFAASFLFNPLAFVALCGLLAFDLYALAVLIAGTPRLRLANLSRSEKNLARCAGVLLLASNWLYLVIARPG
jgi:hypothetical protein